MRNTALYCLIFTVAYGWGYQFPFPSSKKSVTISRSFECSMGLVDLFKNSMANDPSLPPMKNPGLSAERETVEVEFLPSHKKIRAYLGENIGQIAKAARVDIKYKCKKGECGTCTVKFNGKDVKACISAIPSVSKLKKFTIGVPPS